MGNRAGRDRNMLLGTVTPKASRLVTGGGKTWGEHGFGLAICPVRLGSRNGVAWG